MHGATQVIRRMVIMGLVCLALLISSVAASQASTGKGDVVALARFCWLCR